MPPNAVRSPERPESPTVIWKFPNFSVLAQMLLITLYSNKTHLLANSFITFVLEYYQSAYIGQKICNVTLLGIVTSTSASGVSEQLLCQKLRKSILGGAAWSASMGKLPLGQNFRGNQKSNTEHHKHQQVLQTGLSTPTGVHIILYLFYVLTVSYNFLWKEVFRVQEKGKGLKTMNLRQKNLLN